MSSAESIARSLAPGAVGPERLPAEVVALLTLALRRGATDILLAVDRPPSLRVSATLTPVEELVSPGPDAIVRLARTLLGELGLPSVAAQLASLPRGLILVTGPTGSGKSTALAAMIELINSTHAKHI